MFWFPLFPIDTERNIDKILSLWGNVFNERNMSNYCLRCTIFRKYLFSGVIKLYSEGINFHESKKFQLFSGVHFCEFNLFQYLFFHKCVCNTKVSLFLYLIYTVFLMQRGFICEKNTFCEPLGAGVFLLPRIKNILASIYFRDWKI